MRGSGKLLIVSMVAIGLAAAAASWWFRYAATHRAAQFWGPAAARLIRDAPHVNLARLEPSPNGVASDESRQITANRDISAAPGLTHLRYALLEDSSFAWPVCDEPPAVHWTTQLQFRASADPEAASVNVFFSPDYRWLIAATADGAMGRAVSCRPIADGLREMLEPLATSGDTPR